MVKIASGRSDQWGTSFPSTNFHPHSSTSGSSWWEIIDCSQIKPATYEEQSKCFQSAELDGGMLSMDCPRQNRSHLQSFAMTQFDERWYNKTVNLSIAGNDSFTSSVVGWLLNFLKIRVISSNKLQTFQADVFVR